MPDLTHLQAVQAASGSGVDFQTDFDLLHDKYAAQADGKVTQARVADSFHLVSKLKFQDLDLLVQVLR